MIRVIPVLCLLVFGVSFSADPSPSALRTHSKQQCRDLCGDAGIKSDDWASNEEQDGCWHKEGHYSCVCNGMKQ